MATQQAIEEAQAQLRRDEEAAAAAVSAAAQAAGARVREAEESVRSSMTLRSTVEAEQVPFQTEIK